MNKTFCDICQSELIELAQFKIMASTQLNGISYSIYDLCYKHRLEFIKLIENFGLQFRWK